MSFSTRQRLQSFRYAFAGLQAVLRTEHNTWIHLVLTIAAIITGFALRISRMEWTALVIVFALVWIAELFNTVFEKLADLYTTEQHPQVKIIKDMAAAAVLIAAITAFAVGCIIFLPKLISFSNPSCSLVLPLWPFVFHNSIEIVGVQEH